MEEKIPKTATSSNKIINHPLAAMQNFQASSMFWAKLLPDY